MKAVKTSRRHNDSYKVKVSPEERVKKPILKDNTSPKERQELSIVQPIKESSRTN
jgi:hypothetical protein